MRSNSTFKFQFQLMPLRNFFFIKLWNFLDLYLDYGCMNFHLTTQLALSHLSPMPTNKKLECIKTTKCIPKCLGRSVKRKTNLNFNRVKKISFWSTFSLYMVQPFLKIIWGWFLVPRSKGPLISSARPKIFQPC